MKISNFNIIHKCVWQIVSYGLFALCLFSQNVYAENKLLDRNWWKTVTLKQVKIDLKHNDIKARTKDGRTALDFIKKTSI